MQTHKDVRDVPYTADLMFAVVADVERYPEFLPWVVALKVLSRAREGALDILVAEMMVGFRNLRERYTSRVVCDPAARTIDVAQTEGVFRHLENHWRFTPLGQGCRVEFSLAFEFKSRVLDAVAGAAFAAVSMQMTRAFENRARELSQKPAQ